MNASHQEIVRPRAEEGKTLNAERQINPSFATAEHDWAMSTTKDEDARAKVVNRTARSVWLVGLEEGNIRFQLLLRVVSSTHHETKSYVLALPCCAVCCLIFFVSFVRGYYAEGSPSATAPCRILVPSYFVPSISMLGGFAGLWQSVVDDDYAYWRRPGTYQPATGSSLQMLHLSSFIVFTTIWECVCAASTLSNGRRPLDQTQQ